MELTKAHVSFKELYELLGSQRTEQLLSELIAAEKKRIEESCSFRTPGYSCSKPAKYTVRGKLSRGHGERQVFLRSCPTHVGHLVGCPPEGAWTDSRWVVDSLDDKS